MPRVSTIHLPEPEELELVQTLPRAEQQQLYKDEQHWAIRAMSGDSELSNAVRVSVRQIAALPDTHLLQWRRVQYSNGAVDSFRNESGPGLVWHCVASLSKLSPGGPSRQHYDGILANMLRYWPVLAGLARRVSRACSQHIRETG